MKKISLAILFVHLSILSWCQSRERDSLQHILATTKEDTTRVIAMVTLSFYTDNVDSCFSRDSAALKLAREIGFKKGEARALNQLGNDFWNAANYPRAMDNYFQSLRINEEIGDLEGLTSNYSNLSNIYATQEDFPTALQYSYKAIGIRRKTGGRVHVMYAILGNIYEKMNMPDSALAYYSRSYELYNATHDKYQLSSVLSGLGNVHSQKGNTELAFAFYRMGIAAAPQDSEDFSKSYYGLASLFKESGKTDSAFYYAQKGIMAAALWPEMYIKCAQLLSDLYEGRDKDQAFYYYKKAIETKDSIYAAGKQLLLRNLSYNEQERQQEKAAAESKAREDRKHNLQYAAVAIGLMLFAIVFLLLSHSVIVNERFIRFLGIVLLLLVFEFINLFIHPYIVRLTGNSLLFILLVTVCIAALLVPVHHRLEKWILYRLVEKNKKIRLKAAKKTIAELEPQYKEEKKDIY